MLNKVTSTTACKR